MTPVLDGLTKYQRFHRRHRARRLQESRDYRKSNLPRAATRMRNYRKSHPEVISKIEAKRVRPADYREKFNSYSKAWRKKNADRRLASHQKRRAVIVGGSISGAEISLLRSTQNGVCHYCPSQLDNRGRGHLEHKTPLVRGGKHERSNICFACSTCNLKKGRKTESEFLR